MVEGLALAGVIHHPNMRGPFSWVMLSHGLLSHKESPKFIHLAEELANEGIAAVRFDYRGCGQSEGLIEDTTISDRLKDLKTVIRFAIERSDCTGRIGLMGSSLGGYLSLLQASREPRIIATAVWATPSHLTDLEKEKPRENHPRPGDDFYQDLKKYDLFEEIDQIKNALVIHGDQDEIVPVRHAFEIHKRLQSPKEIHILPQGDHRLKRPEDRKQATEMTVAWLKRFLVK